MADISSKFNLIVDSKGAVAGLAAFTKGVGAVNSALAALTPSLAALTKTLTALNASTTTAAGNMAKLAAAFSSLGTSITAALSASSTASTGMAVLGRATRATTASVAALGAATTTVAATVAALGPASTTAAAGLGAAATAAAGLGTVAVTAAGGVTGVGVAATTAAPKVVGFFTAAHIAARKFETLMFSMKGMFAMFGAKWFVDTIAGLERELAILRAITRDPKRSDAENESNMATFKAKAVDIGTRTIFNAESATKGMVELSKAGLEVSEVLRGSEDVLYLAHVGQLDIGKSAEIAARAMNMFGIKAAGLSHVTDILAFTSKHANTSVELLAGGLRYVGATAHLTNQSIETVVAALGVLAKAGRPGFIGGSGLNVVLANLETLGASKARMKIVKALGVAAEDIQGTEGDKAVLKKLGLTEKDLRPSLHSLEDIIQKFKDLKLSSHDLEIVTEKLFGKRGGPTFAILVEHVDDFKKSVAALNSEVNKGIAAVMSKTIIDTLSGSWARLKGTIEAVFVMKADDSGTLKFLRDTTVAVRHLIEALAGIKSDELSKDQIEYYQKWASAIILLTKAYVGLKAAFFLRDVLTGILGGLTSIVAKTLAWAAATNAATAAALAARAAAGAGGATSTVATGAGLVANMSSIGAALSSTLLYWGKIAGIVGLVASAIYVAYQQTKEMVDNVKGLMKVDPANIKSIKDSFLGEFSDLGILSTLKDLKGQAAETFKGIKDGIKESGIYELLYDKLEEAGVIKQLKELELRASLSFQLMKIEGKSFLDDISKAWIKTWNDIKDHPFDMLGPLGGLNKFLRSTRDGVEHLGGNYASMKAQTAGLLKSRLPGYRDPNEKMGPPEALKTAEQVLKEKALADRLNLEAESAATKRQNALDRLEAIRKQNAVASERDDEKAIQRWRETTKEIDEEAKITGQPAALKARKAAEATLWQEMIDNAKKRAKELIKAEDEINKHREDGQKITRHMYEDVLKLRLQASGHKIELIDMDQRRKLEDALESVRKFNLLSEERKTNLNKARADNNRPLLSPKELEKLSPTLSEVAVRNFNYEETLVLKRALAKESEDILKKMYEDEAIARMKANGDEVGAEKLAAQQVYNVRKESLRKQFEDNEKYAEAVKLLDQGLVTARIADALKADKILADIKLQTESRNAARYGRKAEHAAIEALRRDEADLAAFEKLLDMTKKEDQAKAADYRIQLGKRTAETIAEQENKGFVSTRELLREFSNQMMKTFDDMILSGKGFTEIMKDLEKAIVNMVYKTLVLNPLLTQMEKALQGAGGAGGSLNKNPMTILLGALGIGSESKKGRAQAASDAASDATLGPFPQTSAAQAEKAMNDLKVTEQLVTEQIINGPTQVLGNVEAQQSNVVQMTVESATINSAIINEGAEGVGTGILKSIMGSLPGAIGAPRGGAGETLGAGSSTAGLTQLSSGLWQRGPAATPNENGGSLGRDALSIVGERGPELFVPTQAGTVIPHKQTMRILQAMKTGNMQLVDTLMPNASKMKFAAQGAELRAGQPAIAGEEGRELYVHSGQSTNNPSGPAVGRGAGGPIQVSMQVVNNSSQPVDAKTSQPRFDGKRWIINTVLEDMARNGDLRKAFRQ